MSRILLTVTRGLIARNMLRCGVLAHLLRNPDSEIIIGVPRLELYFEQEFEHPRVRFVVLPAPRRARVERMIQSLYRDLVFTTNEELCIRWGNTLNIPNEGGWLEWRIRFLRTWGSLKLVKRLARIGASWIPAQREYVELIRALRPDVVFTPDVQGVCDVAIQRAARACHVPIVAMTKGWENAARRFYWVLPDQLLVQNEQVRQDAAEHQLIPANRICLVGFPQFDAYVNREHEVSRIAHLRQLGFLSDRKLILFGSEGHWSAHDDRIVDRLIELNQNGAFGAPCGIIVRPHFSDASNPRYQRFRGVPDVFVDDRFRLSSMFPDQWDPSVEDMRWFLNHLSHLDVMVTFASTLSLDAAMVDAPIVNVCYGAHFSPDGIDLTRLLYDMHHYKGVLKTGAIDQVWNDEQLAQAIRSAIVNRSARATARARLRESYCACSDGTSAKRIADKISQYAQHL